MTAIVAGGKGNLKMINGSENSGLMLIAKKINGCNEFKLIKQSVTGLYEQVIDLLTV